MTNSAVASPSSWAQAYVGLPYIVGVGECAQRAALVWRQEFGFHVEPPASFGHLRAAQRYVLNELNELNGPDWARVLRPAEGDAVVMFKGDLLCHVGVWVAPGHVLHCTRTEGIVLTAEEDLAGQGFRVFGFFRRRAEQALAA